MAFWNKQETISPQEQVTQAIDSLERSNAMIVRIAHVFAFLLIIATSVASLISLAATLVIVVLAGHGTVPADASIAITLLLVLAMDVGMVLASTYIRIGLQRGETAKQLWGHFVILLVVSLLEAGTYTYMLVIYEKPDTWQAWALIIARGFAVPVLCLYLSMARRITVNTQDIAVMIEIFSGVGLLKDLAQSANDPTAPLDRKIMIYRASATLSDAQRAKLDAMHIAVKSDAPVLPPAIITPDAAAGNGLVQLAAPNGNGHSVVGDFTALPEAVEPSPMIEQMNDSAPVATATQVKVAPKPKTKAFTAAVRKAIGSIEVDGVKATLAQVAQLMNESEADVQPDFDAIMADRAITRKKR